MRLQLKNKQPEPDVVICCLMVSEVGFDQGRNGRTMPYCSARGSGVLGCHGGLTVAAEVMGYSEILL